jgi:hypothetical protein
VQINVDDPYGNLLEEQWKLSAVKSRDNAPWGVRLPWGFFVPNPPAAVGKIYFRKASIFDGKRVMHVTGSDLDGARM